jgi:hypothetical protein
MTSEPMYAISIGQQSGGPEDGGIGDLKVELFKILRKHCPSTLCSAIDQFVVILRVDGAVR